MAEDKDEIRFIGISPAHDAGNPYLPFPLCAWLIVEKASGKKAYLKPETVKFYEDDHEPDTHKGNSRASGCLNFLA